MAERVWMVPKFKFLVFTALILSKVSVGHAAHIPIFMLFPLSKVGICSLNFKMGTEEHKRMLKKIATPGSLVLSRGDVQKLIPVKPGEQFPLDPNSKKSRLKKIFSYIKLKEKGHFFIPTHLDHLPIFYIAQLLHNFGIKIAFSDILGDSTKAMFVAENADEPSLKDTLVFKREDADFMRQNWASDLRIAADLDFRGPLVHELVHAQTKIDRVKLEFSVFHTDIYRLESKNRLNSLTTFDESRAYLLEALYLVKKYIYAMENRWEPFEKFSIQRDLGVALLPLSHLMHFIDDVLQREPIEMNIQKYQTEYNQDYSKVFLWVQGEDKQEKLAITHSFGVEQIYTQGKVDLRKVRFFVEQRNEILRREIKEILELEEFLTSMFVSVKGDLFALPEVLIMERAIEQFTTARNKRLGISTPY